MNHRFSVAFLTNPPLSASSFTSWAKRPKYPARIAWIQWPGYDQFKRQSLYSNLVGEGMNVAIFHGERKSLEQLFYYDLILMEPPDSMNLHTYQALNRIRLGSRAPLLLLTDDHPVEWSINAFRCGADAILPWSTSNDVIVARCKALLRRWLPHSH